MGLIPPLSNDVKKNCTIGIGRLEEQNEAGDVKLQLDSAFLKLKRIFLDRIEHDQKGFKKALTTFDKHLDRMPKSNDAVLQKALCTFGQDSIAPLKLAKRKNSRLIPVQVKRGLSIHWFAHRILGDRFLEMDGHWWSCL